ncbi:acetyl-CoA synthetase-like protein [Sodiomyces alkalinus F11]|uniref:Acetyl-CoA synthetase-like protein n=1 Tax=Sodiomyces alkalinus (strain CBS 110278 / VKM F-3762 / F11) TaxID=1314773 RepID=A0A3N2PYU3_SODAK|nr:acetyl-CoA synthetase-like protein [Sodiomyces alkalinus F11]ROT39596.1 acetyl-CoA synthetase-like protein [Sodiomyces alkalinus F11]
MGISEALQYPLSTIKVRPVPEDIHVQASASPHYSRNENCAYTCVQDLLKAAAQLRPQRRILVYPPGNTSSPIAVEYANLYSQARALVPLLQSLDGFQRRCPVLIHLDNHWDTLLWFWAVLLSNSLPVLSSPFSQDESLRRKHIQGLSGLLETPLCITRNKLLDLFGQDHGLRLHTVEHMSLTPFLRRDSTPSVILDVVSHANTDPRTRSRTDEHDAGLAILMLTSGSTGNAKAVRLTHDQIFAAIQGKASARPLDPTKPFLNWIGLDHVASLVEIHLQAMALGLDQVHVHAADVVSSPSVFLDLLTRHRVSRSFAPNFFLAKLVSTVRSSPGDGTCTWDLRSLGILASGGEANDVEVCVAASELFAKYGAGRDVITPGFGMTETCAGAIYNLDCPAYDVKNGRSFASLGKCVNGIEMRVMLPSGERSGLFRHAAPDEPGDLEVRGKIVFDGYYRNTEATSEAFTPDGWFRTGDRATIDSDGNLHLLGRVKDVMNVNGVKMSSADVQTAIEDALAGIGKVHVALVVSFPSRDSKAYTEQVTVAYIPHQWPPEPEDVARIHHAVAEACIVCTGSRPAVFGVRDQSSLPVSALGKISRAKMRVLYEKGAFQDEVDFHNAALEQQRWKNLTMPTNELEATLLMDLADVLGVNTSHIGVETPMYDMGFTSMDLVRLKHRLDKRFATSIPVVTLMKNPTVRALATALSSQHEVSPAISQKSSSPDSPPYDPVVTFRPDGSKTPLWLIHPGVGEVLVFIGLAQHLADDDRPIYALRARGFEPGHAPFSTIDQVVDAYRAAILQRQPQGPYAIAGYSYGTMLAFEVAKRLEKENGATIQFLGSFNLPPHIKPRMRQLNWNMCLLHLAYFLGLVSEAYADSIEDGFRALPREEAMPAVLGIADKQRLLGLGLDRDALAGWATLAFGLQSMAVDYEPSGLVESMDVFHATPLKVAARSREDWIHNHLSKWRDFCRTDVRFHAVGGAHYTMIGPDHVGCFAATLKEALRSRGL